MRVGARLFRVLVVVAVFCALLVSSRAQARSAGVGSGLFGASANGCNQCHSGGTAPTVALSASSLDLSPGDQITLTFTVTTPNASDTNNGAAGFNLRSSKAGTFAIGGANSANTQVGTALTGTNTNGFSEATQTSPKTGEPATFTVLWTPNAGTTGAVTFTAWGNAVNLSGTPTGDRAASVTQDIFICVPQTWYRDMDGDGYGALPGTVSACVAPVGYVASNTDCNDSSPAVHPGATEVCNGSDDNCAGGVDEGLATTTFYRDFDSDGYGAVASGTTAACSLARAGAGYVVSNTDCNDANLAIHPGATEVCNGSDDNCAGGVDEGLATSTFYRDADGDGYGTAATSKVACSLAQAGAGYVTNATDCNDGSLTVHPGATEICNTIDDNCSGAADEGGVCVGVGAGGAGGEGGQGGEGGVGTGTGGTTASGGISGTTGGISGTTGGISGTTGGISGTTGGISGTSMGGTAGIGTDSAGAAGVGIGVDAGGAGGTPGVDEGGSAGVGVGGDGSVARGGTGMSGGAVNSGGGTRSGGAAGTATAGTAGGGSPPGSGTDNAGCSCRSAGSGPGDALFLVVAVLGLALVVRRRQS